MVWISLLLLTTISFAKEFPKFLTKHSIESLRFMSNDGRYAYVTKKTGVLGLVSSFRSVDFISDAGSSDFIVQGSRFKKRLAIEVVPNAHTEQNLIKNHKVMVVDYGNTFSRDVGAGVSAKLHLEDEWISFYQPYDRNIVVKNLLTDRSYAIKLSSKISPFFVPEVEMINSENVLFSDVNDKGNIGLTQYNLSSSKSTVIFRSGQTGTQISMCQEKSYLAFGEFPYDDLIRESSINSIPIGKSANLGGYASIYTSPDSDLGNLVCTEQHIYFIKTMSYQKSINTKVTELVKLNLKSSKVEALTDLGNITQVIKMDNRIMVPYRGDFYVIEGEYNLSDDKLKTQQPANKEEELPFEI